jgi:uncharacterized protein YyaL (SSP411 family)
MVTAILNKLVLKGANQAILLLLFLYGCSGHQQKLQNRLQYASSPYLKEHADNPVDWYEWGDEALTKAKNENKPLLISIGYASCHWCHEMAKESFMDTAVARIMNENFICIKVDREERPDIDNIYMNALQLLSGDAGWPLNAFALPDGKPFFAGTYYAKKSWMNLLMNVSTSYQKKYKLVETQANALVNGISEHELSLTDTTSVDTKIKSYTYKELFDSIYKHTDLVNGGLKGVPKFPTPAFTEFLMQYHYITGSKPALAAALTTLKKTAMGGIYDQIGGGFSRYATDSLWQIPHFEKMLYDNGQLVSVYAHAYQLTKDEFYKKIFVETLDFIDKNLAAPGGGYYSSLNADTEKGEGAYYCWTKNDFDAVTGNNEMAACYFHVSDKGNWKTGNNILFSQQLPELFALEKKIPVKPFTAMLNEAKTRLYKERSKRTQPSVDSKIITSWNCILLKAFADAYAATGIEDYLLKAQACAVFIEKNMLTDDGKLKRNYNGGKVAIDGFLDDYAWAANAFIKLYEVSFDKHWLLLSKNIADYTIRNFFNTNTALFYYTEGQQNLVLRKTEIDDNAIPSSNAVMAKVLYKLGIIYDDRAYTQMSLKMYNAVSGRIEKQALYHLEWCSYAGILSSRSYEIVMMGKDAITKNKVLQRSYLPTSTVMGSTNGDTLPLLKDKAPGEKTMIYVCTDKTCKRPEEEVSTAIKQIFN